MKLYIINKIKDDNNKLKIYELYSECGDYINFCCAYSLETAKKLIYNEYAQFKCKNLFGNEDIEILCLGDDDMTLEVLLKLNKQKKTKEYSMNIELMSSIDKDRLYSIG